MEFSSYQNRLSQLSARFNLMVCLVFGLLISNVSLALLVGFTTYHQKIEITPFFGGESYHKSAATLDAHYLELMSENFVYSRLNVTPETVRSNYNRLSTYIDASSFAEMMKRLNFEASLIELKKISSTFSITHMRADTNRLTVDVTGVLRRHVGIRELSPESVTYHLAYQYHQGHLTIVKFTKLKEKSDV
jgi:conjugal transfer pilus assembly protein TraE